VAYFGYPDAVESAGRDAVAAGLAVIEAVARLGAELPGEFGVSELQARVGIHTGDVVVAAIHSGGVNRIPDVFGEAPNLAARLQASSNAGELIVSDATASLVSGFFELAPVGALTLKGIPRQVPAFRVVKRSAARTRLERGNLTAFVPRSAAGAWLDAQWTAIEGGAAHLALVKGEPGIGKSRLVQEFAQRVTSTGYAAVTLLCSQRDALSPLFPFRSLMDDVPLTPDVAAAWAIAQSGGGPTLFVVEDAHWADPSTMEAFNLVARAERPILILMTARPEGAGHPDLPLAQQLELERMSPDDALRIVRRVRGGDALPAEVQQALVRQADGVPLYLEELTRGMVERSHDPDAAPGIPATLAEVITARLGHLGDAKRVAQVAAIVGRSFEPQVLQAVSGLDGPSLEREIQRLIGHAVIEPSASGVATLWFRHALLHEAAYGSVLRADRRRTHSRVAEVLLEAGRAEIQPEIVAFHLGASGQAAGATEMWRRAARAARSHARFGEAAGHEREVLALLPQLPEADRDAVELATRGRLALCLAAVDQNSAQALAEAMRVQDLAERTGDRLALLRNYLVLLPWWQANADYASIERTLPEAERLAVDIGDAWSQGALHQMAGIVRIWQGRATEGLAQLENPAPGLGVPLEVSLATLPELAPPAVMMMASVRIGASLGCWLTGRVADAGRIGEDARRFAQERSVPQAQAVTAATAAIVAQLDGDRDAAWQLAGEAAQLGGDVATRQWQQWAASLCWWSGAGELEPEVPGPLLRPYFLMLLADDDRVTAERAHRLLDEALATARDTGERFCEAEILRVRGMLLARTGRLGEAMAALDEAIDVARQQGAQMLELRALTGRARLPHPNGTVLAELQGCVDRLTSGGDSRSLREAVSVLESP
jgi:tetratricopeptide (TPR) repeat protein